MDATIAIDSGRNAVSFYAQMGQRIREARKAAKITQEELGGKLALSRTSIANIEKGRQKILAHTFVAVARELKVSISDLAPEQKVETELHPHLSKKERNFVLSVVSELKKGK